MRCPGKDTERMKKFFSFLFSALILVTLFSGAASANGFSEDPDAVEQKLKSVLMLEVYADDELIATGSGFCAFDNRTLITNYHVIKGADSVIAYSDSGDPYFVFHVLTADAERDIAILSFFSPTDLVPLPLNTDGPLRRAEKVVAIGSPLGITNTVAEGIISGLYTEEGVSMIQFTAPISPGSSGGALFDDSGSVIGITTSTLTRGQNINLAVHISEAVALYGRWDGSRTEMKGYRPGKSIRAAVTPKPTPTPSPTPTPKPTPSLIPISTSEAGDKFWDSTLESCRKLEITNVTMRSNGDVDLTWAGGTPPYTVCYQIVDNQSQDDVLYDRFYWLNEDDIHSTSTVIKLIVPDHLYRIDVMDKMGYRVSTYYRHLSRFFTGDDGQNSVIGLRIKKNGVISKPFVFSCSALEASVKNETSDDTLYGMYVKIFYGNLNRNYEYTMRLALELPNGDIIVLALYTSSYSGTTDKSVYWEFINFSSAWECIFSLYHRIPAGNYNFYVYMDNMLLTTRTFTFK